MELEHGLASLRLRDQSSEQPLLLFVDESSRTRRIAAGPEAAFGSRSDHWRARRLCRPYDTPCRPSSSVSSKRNRLHPWYRRENLQARLGQGEEDFAARRESSSRTGRTAGSNRVGDYALGKRVGLSRVFGYHAREC